MKGTRILLIDDETDFSETLAERLEIRGFETELASDGEKGIKLVKDKEFDVVILDLKMPGLSGIETLKSIKKIKKDLPVILLTGQGSTKDGEEGKKMGAHDYLIKPLKIDEFIEKVLGAIHK
ncbi:MAG: response regulator [Proteobacteria bacterium]|nr:response regulator [Pseudomonadota bacterium]